MFTDSQSQYDEPKLMRTMEAYFKETQSNGNNMAKKDDRD